MPIFSYDGSPAQNTFFNNYNGNGVAAVLYIQEMSPSNPGYWGLDASVEEIIHTINAVGHANVYQSAFSTQPNSSLMSAAMDVARGGQFLTIPNPYPAAAWYHYDDVTCDYECMAIEYFYWAEVTNMGILNDIPTCAGIANEWEPCSPTLFQATDVLMYNLITDLQYKIPQLAPDGNYCPASLSVNKKMNDKSFEINPNPINSQLTIILTEKNNVSIIDVTGKILETNNYQKGKIKIDVSNFSDGIYIVKIGNRVKKLMINR